MRFGVGLIGQARPGWWVGGLFYFSAGLVEGSLGIGSLSDMILLLIYIAGLLVALGSISDGRMRR